jgi:hypothetical protein
MLGGAWHRPKIRRRSHIQRQRIEGECLPVRASHLAARRVDSDDARRHELGAGTITERPEIDVALLPAVVACDQAWQHAAVGRVGLRTDQNEPKSLDPGHPEAPKDFDMRVAAAGEH